MCACVSDYVPELWALPSQPCVACHTGALVPWCLSCTPKGPELKKDPKTPTRFEATPGFVGPRRGAKQGGLQEHQSPSVSVPRLVASYSYILCSLLGGPLSPQGLWSQ